MNRTKKQSKENNNRNSNLQKEMTVNNIIPKYTSIMIKNSIKNEDVYDNTTHRIDCYNDRMRDDGSEHTDNLTSGDAEKLREQSF